MKAKMKQLPRKTTKQAFNADPSAMMQTERDFKDALLTVSVFANLFILCLWVAIQATTKYDAALIGFFVNR